ncbi:MAG: OsmC family peroxiredoxin, partial [Thermus caldifontis]
TITHIASGPGVTLEALERAAHLSHTKYCSVSANLNAEITVKVVLEPWEEDQG